MRRHSTVARTIRMLPAVSPVEPMYVLSQPAFNVSTLSLGPRTIQHARLPMSRFLVGVALPQGYA